jgi:MarR-like DNA-binding transcriptional regulator SgrR of sgrS sRNA
MIKTIILVLALVVGSVKDRTYRCDMLELNHFHDYEGRPAFDQVILWKWDQLYSEYHVSEYYMVDQGKSTEDNRVPQKNYSSGLYEAWKGTNKVIAPHYRESWTQIDPERADKKKLDERLRVRTFQYANSPNWTIDENGNWIDLNSSTVIIPMPQVVPAAPIVPVPNMRGN